MEKPILFNTEMVQAILQGKKTSTRRPIKQPFEIHEKGNTIFITHPKDFKDEYCRFHPYEPPCQVGDILWVRETWCTNEDMNDNAFDEGITPGYYYKVTDDGKIPYWNNDKDVIYRWHPSIHMPKKAARIFLKVIDVKVQRVQDITGKDVLAEGVDNGKSNPTMGERWENMQRQAYQDLWNSLYEKKGQGWNANPWVWVISFERLEG